MLVDFLYDYVVEIIGGGGAFAIFVVVLKRYLTFEFERKLAKEQAKREAGQVLRQSFKDVHEIMNFEHKKDTYDSWSDTKLHALQDAFPKQDAAVKEFARHLRGSRRCKFLEAWEKYHNFYGSERYATQYLFMDSNRIDPLILFNERVEAILAFTEDEKPRNILVRLCNFCKKFSKSA